MLGLSSVKRFATPEKLLECFRDLDRDQVQLPHDMVFPLVVRDYLSWIEPSGARVYLVFDDPFSSLGPVGVVFKRTSSSGDSPAQMCQWCHSVRGGGRVGLLTATAGRKRRVGVYLCRDLDCREKIFGKRPDVNDLRESLGKSQRLDRVLEKMSDFARENLF